MKLEISREALLKPIQRVIGIVARGGGVNGTPLLGNILVSLGGGVLTMTATDLELEVKTTVPVDTSEKFTTTIPARKLHDLVRSLPDGALITITINADRTVLRSEAIKFSLATLSSENFPSIGYASTGAPSVLNIQAKVLVALIGHTQHAMARSDVRTYLNGMLFEVVAGQFRCVATDGHRLSLASATADAHARLARVVVPRRAIQELLSLLADVDRIIKLEFTPQFLRITLDDVEFITRLVDGAFPVYESIIPAEQDKRVVVDRQMLVDAIKRVDVLSDDRQLISMEISPEGLKFSATNKDREVAFEQVDVATRVPRMIIGYNSAYMLDALRAGASEDAQISFTDAHSSMLITEAGDARDFIHVIMPVRL
jgi:DNA polymerase-3 subunit beta